MWNTIRQPRWRKAFFIRQLTLPLLVGILAFGWLGQQALGQNADAEEELFVLICVDSATGGLRIGEDCVDGEVAMTLATGAGLARAFARTDALVASVSELQEDLEIRIEAIEEGLTDAVEEIDQMDDRVTTGFAEVQVEIDEQDRRVDFVEEAVVRQEEELEMVEDTVASAVAEVEEQTIVIEDLTMVVDRLESQTIDQATALEALEETVAGLTPPTVAFNSTDDAPDDNFVLSTQITAPEKGILLMAGGVDAKMFLDDGTYSCRLMVDPSTLGEDAIVDGSVRWSRLDGDTFVDAEDDFPVNFEENCTTSGAREVEAGIHTVEFNVFNLLGSANYIFNDASVWALWVPLDEG